MSLEKQIEELNVNFKKIIDTFSKIEIENLNENFEKVIDILSSKNIEIEKLQVGEVSKTTTKIEEEKSGEETTVTKDQVKKAAIALAKLCDGDKSLAIKIMGCNTINELKPENYAEVYAKLVEAKEKTEQEK